MLLEDYISHRIPRILRFSSIDVSYASVFEPTEFVASSATTAGTVFAKASDTSLWVLRAKLFGYYIFPVYLWWRQIFYFLRAELKKF